MSRRHLIDAMAGAAAHILDAVGVNRCGPGAMEMAV